MLRREVVDHCVEFTDVLLADGVGDAAVIVVSEETGGVSFVKDGQVRAVKDFTRLREFLAESGGRTDKETKAESEGQQD